MLKIAFFGLPLAALLLARDGHDIVYAGICRRGAIGTRRLRRRLGARVAVAPRLDEALALRLEAAAPDLLVSWFWTKRIPERFLALAPMGTVGVHPSLLPRHRGPDPTYWTIRSGDARAGVTAHRLERDYDTGAILGVRALDVDPAWNAWTLAKKLDRPSLALLREVVAMFAKGEAPREERQDERLATAAPAPSDDDLRLDPRASGPEELARQVRAAAPFPGAWLDLEGEVVVITKARPAPAPAALVPGEAAVVAGVATLCTVAGGLALLEGRVVPEGEGESEIDLDAAGLAALVLRLSEAAPLAYD